MSSRILGISLDSPGKPGGSIGSFTDSSSVPPPPRTNLTAGKAGRHGTSGLSARRPRVDDSKLS